MDLLILNTFYLILFLIITKKYIDSCKRNSELLNVIKDSVDELEKEMKAKNSIEYKQGIAKSLDIITENYFKSKGIEI